ncbi:septum site-determining protein Ssd [Rhodococcus sp. NPDC003318]|uniref:septum site-determining protein Ssd n=1 Tax=Rhodococcus sp. NPDC003318 TaxID=3364503 RepID=UPI003684FF20
MKTITDGPPPQVLALIRDADLAAGVRRAAAAADRDVLELVAPVPRRTWVDAPRIVLDPASAHDSAEAGLPRRGAVHLVCPATPGLIEWRAAAAVGAESVLALPSGEADLVAALTRRAEGRVDGRGAVVAVIGGRGGAGASTLSAALALTCRSRHPGRRALLVDCDPQGGGLDLLVGAEHRPGLRWRSLVIEGGAVSADALHGALPNAGDGISVLSFGRGRTAAEPGAAALTAVVDAGRAAGDVVVCDVPRQVDGITQVALGLADLVVVLVRAQVRAVAAAEALIATVREIHPNVVAVVRGPSPGGLRGPEIAGLLGVPLLATLRPESGLDAALERGGLRLGRRSPLRRAAGAILDVLDAGGTAA